MGMYCLANLRARQELFGESLNYHQEAPLYYVVARSHNSYEANMMCVKVAGDIIPARINMKQPSLSPSLSGEKSSNGFSQHLFRQSDGVVQHP